MRYSRFFIHAMNVHNGGGRTLLNSLLNAFEGDEVSLTVDERFPLPANMSNSVRVKKVAPTVFSRFGAERWLAHNVGSEDIVLCFGNLPPLFKLRGKTFVFVQNRYLIDNIPLDNFPLKVRLRLLMERLWLAKRSNNVDSFIVQTLSMKKLLDKEVLGKVPVHVYPFISCPEGYVRCFPHVASVEVGSFDFVYVASGEPHKNHQQLIEAWCLLAQEGLFPSLTLTVDELQFAELYSKMVQNIVQCQLNVVNIGNVSHNQIAQLYREADALIYPSTFESFGLPLVEARQAGLAVLASELDYVRDVLDPEQGFDPNSATSIARAVKRFMGVEESPLPLQDGAGFIKTILKMV